MRREYRRPPERTAAVVGSAVLVGVELIPVVVEFHQLAVLQRA
jgi:hypothetical protein